MAEVVGEIPVVDPLVAGILVLFEVFPWWALLGFAIVIGWLCLLHLLGDSDVS
jgi:hypothetical protein